jgi:hypothetical protein
MIQLADGTVCKLPAHAQQSHARLRKTSLAGVAVAHCEPQPKKRFLADAAGHSTVITNLLFVVVQRVKRPEINFGQHSELER